MTLMLSHPFGTMAAQECPGAAVTAPGVTDPKEVDVPERTCSIEGCTKVGNGGRGWCHMHYSRWRTWGDPTIRRGKPWHADIRVRFMENVEVDPSGCWLWTGRLTRADYGVFSVPGEGTFWVHRLAYEWFVGPIPEGFHIDHVYANGCRHHNCVNWVDHLEPVTPAENVRRSRRELVTECAQGHPYTPENSYIRPKAPTHRHCRECGRIATRAWSKNRKSRRKPS